ncbi:MAG: CopD family protein [Bdellovibrionales bacterium]|nr:CopD family protein [Bdellovibrionales bacterium]
MGMKKIATHLGMSKLLQFAVGPNVSRCSLVFQEGSWYALPMTVLYLKALHIIFVVTWFAGLFYIVRLFIYHTEALQEAEPRRSILATQFKIMSRRLWYGITWPSAVLTASFASALLFQAPGMLSQGWLHLKLLFVLALYAYHFACHKIFLGLQRDQAFMSSFQLRLWNELATIFLFAIVFLVVLKNSVSLLWGMLFLFFFSLLLMGAIRYFRKRTERRQLSTNHS